MAGGKGGGNNDNGLIFPLVMIGLGIFFIVVLWILFKTPIVLFLYAIDVIQYAPLYYLRILDEYSVGEFLHCVDTLKWLLHPVHGMRRAGVIDPQIITLENLRMVQADIGHYTWPVYAAIIGWFTYQTNEKMLGNRMRRKFSLTGKIDKKTGKPNGLSFMAFQAREWTPAQFTKVFNPEDRTYFTEAPVRVMTFLRLNKISLTAKGGLDRNALERVFEKQIGRTWTGFKNEPFYIKAFMMMCMATLQLDSKVSDKFRADLDRAFYSKKSQDEIEKMVMGIVNELDAKEPDLIPVINEVASNHAYSNTACLGVIGYCGPFTHWNGGQGSMIPPPSYMWIMLYDRILYLALNVHGKYGISSFIEAAGVISHYQVERLYAAPQPTKYALEAVKGTEEWLKNKGITDMDTFNRGRANGQRRYKIRRQIESSEKQMALRLSSEAIPECYR